jgi:hypothetical protein
MCAALTLPACAKLKAKTPPAAPATPPQALEMPEPPQRLHIPVTAEAPPPAPPPASTSEKPASSTAPKPRPTPPPSPTTTPPDATPPVLQTGSLGELEVRAKERLGSAERDLAKVQAASLSADGREQYNWAQRFVRLTQDALARKNFVYAAYCADKAATLAALLVKKRPTS